MAVPPGCDECSEAAQVVRTDLGAIGIEVDIRRVDSAGLSSKEAASFDLIDVDSWIPYPDSASFLKQLLKTSRRNGFRHVFGPRSSASAVLAETKGRPQPQPSPIA